MNYESRTESKELAQNLYHVLDSRPMITITDESGCWPTPNQQLMLRASLLRGNEAIEAWNEWKQRVNTDQIDWGSYRLIPLLYRNLLVHGIQDSLLNTFTEVCSYYSTKNEILFEKASRVLRAFHDIRIATIALKGLALVPLYYKESGIRPMQDVDILVPTEQACTAMALLRKLGYKPVFTSCPETWIAIRHSIPFEDYEGHQIDLHWHLLWECWNANDCDYWESTTPITINDVRTLTLSPTFQLLHTCWHGARWNEVPPIRWIADSMAILNDADRIDWHLIVEQAERHRISLLLEDSLQYLQMLLGDVVPNYVIKSLHDLPVSKIEQLARNVATDPLAPRSTVNILRLLWYDYRWLTSSTSLKSKALAFARFLQDRWKIDHLWQLPFVLLWRGLRRVFGDMTNIYCSLRHKP